MSVFRLIAPGTARPRQAAKFQVESLERRVLLSSAIAAFGAQQTFGTSSNPRSVAIADVNNDGKLDLLVANSVGNTVSVLLGNGNGSYQTQQNFSVGSTPFSIAAADVNGDGKLDLITANNGANNVSVLLSNGNGTFQSQKTFGAGTNSRFVAVADTNGDGKPDLITANYGAGTISVLLGNGNGTFANQQTFSAGTKPSSIAVGDFNVDGRLDLAVVNKGSNNVSILLGNGNGTFQNRQLSAVGSAPFSIAAGDLNQDGKLDLVTADESSNAVSVLLGNGNGTFQTHQTYATGTIPCAVALTDINGDGKLDVVAANYSTNNLSVLLGNGDGTFQAQKTFSTGSNAFAIAVVDINRDGRQDLLVANEGAGNVGQLLGDVPPTVLSINRSSPAGPDTQAVSVSYAVTFNESVTGVDQGDFSLQLSGVSVSQPLSLSGSGANYTVTINGISGSGRLGLNLLDDGDIKDGAGNPLKPGGVIAFQPQQTFADAQEPGWPVAADLNGDGKLDVVTVDGLEPGHAHILLGNGNGTFLPPTAVATAAGPDSVAVADMNGDGKQDLVVANHVTPGSISVLLGNGDGTFQPQQTFGAYGGPASVGVADLNGDGRLDVFAADNVTTHVSVLLGNGNGTLQPQVTYATGGYAQYVTAADVNGDGKLDLVVGTGRINMGGGVSVLLGNGNGTFQAPITFSTGLSPSWIAVGDFNSDGKPDLAIRLLYVSDSQLAIWLGNGDGTFRLQQTFDTPLDGAVTASDLNGDGKIDLAINLPRAIGVLLGNGNGTFQLGQTFFTNKDAGSIAVADVNGDGRPDLLTASAYSGYYPNSVAVMLGNSNGNFTGQVFTFDQDTVTGTNGADQITLTADSDRQHLDWSIGSTTGLLLINDPNGLTVNGNGGTDVITLSYNTLPPNIVHLNGTFTIGGLSIFNPLANTTLEIGRSTVYLSYSSIDWISSIQSYLQTGYNNGNWNGTPAANSGVITSTPAAQNAAQTTAIGYADSADGLIPGQPVNTIELKYTLYGDTTLTGTVGFNDFTRLTQHYNQTTGGTWDTGDFNYDGSVNFADFTLMTRTYNTSLGNQAYPATSVVSEAAAVASVAGVSQKANAKTATAAIPLAPRVTSAQPSVGPARSAIATMTEPIAAAAVSPSNESRGQQVTHLHRPAGSITGKPGNAGRHNVRSKRLHSGTFSRTAIRPPG